VPLVGTRQRVRVPLVEKSHRAAWAPTTKVQLVDDSASRGRLDRASNGIRRSGTRARPISDRSYDLGDDVVLEELDVGEIDDLCAEWETTYEELQYPDRFKYEADDDDLDLD
jgi:hypothetical protein